MVSQSTSTSNSKVDFLIGSLRDQGWSPGLSEESYEKIIAAGFRSKNLLLASVVAEICLQERPITVRGLMYRTVSAGWLPSTDKEHYNRTVRLTSRLREHGLVPFSWIVDNVRNTIKPSSWSGLAEFTETVQDSYRKDFWASMPSYVHVFCEKDAIAGTIAPITRRFDVALSPIRGYVSLSFANEIANTWNRIEKPIHAYYVGDYDASGFDLERDVREKLSKYCNNQFTWSRLAVNEGDFTEFDLIPLKPKTTDTRYAKFVAKHGMACAEVDAIPPTELRERVEEAIESHVDKEQWIALQQTEERERKDFNRLFAGFKG